MIVFALISAVHAADVNVADKEESMAMLLVALFMIGVAYLLAHFVVDRLQRRYLFVSGVEYILLGIGLSFFQIFQHSASFMPAIAFALGWVGILYGLTGDLKMQRQEENGYDMRLAVMETLVVGTGVGVLSAFFFQFISNNSNDALACGAMLGCSAAAGSSSAVKVSTVIVVVGVEFPKGAASGCTRVTISLAGPKERALRFPMCL